MTRKLWAAVLSIGIAASLVVVLALGFRQAPGVIASPLLNKPAPRFALQTLAGGSALDLRAMHGQPVIVNFWASWCTSCKDEHAVLKNAWRLYGHGRVRFIGIDYQDSVTDARAFLQRYGGGWPVLRDPESTTALNYGVYGVPETFFIDRHGVVRFKSTGPVSADLMTREIGRLLRRQA